MNARGTTSLHQRIPHLGDSPSCAQELSMSTIKTLEVPVKGMDCAECTQHVQHAIAALPGVESVNVFLTSEKAVVRLDLARVDLPAIRKAVEGAGYSIPETATPSQSPTPVLGDFTRRIVTFLAVVFGAVLFIIVVGEI